MNFGKALEAVQAGALVARAGWNGVQAGKTMFLYQVKGSTFEVNRPPLLGIFPEGTKVTYLPHIDMAIVKGDEITAVPWLASQTDIQATDWEVVNLPRYSSTAPIVTDIAG